MRSLVLTVQLRSPETCTLMVYRDQLGTDGSPAKLEMIWLRRLEKRSDRFNSVQFNSNQIQATGREKYPYLNLETYRKLRLC